MTIRRGNRNNTRPSLRIRLFPIVFFATYLTFTVLLFAFGPWPYPIGDGTTLYIFLALAHFSLLAGYFSAISSKPRPYYGQVDFRRLLTISLVVNLILLIPTATFRTDSIVPSVLQGISDPGEAYTRLGFFAREGTPIIEYVRVFFGPFLFMLSPLTLFYWQVWKSKLRILASFCIIASLAIFIAMGTNKLLADFALTAPFMMIGALSAGILRLRARAKIALSLGLAVIFAAFLIFFTATQATRPGSGAITGYFPATETHADSDHFLLRSLPIEAKIGALGLTSALTQGYYALYLSLNEPFIPTYGVGNSMFLLRQAARITGDDTILWMPYPMRIEKHGWDAYGLWASIYPWIASDVSFLGTLIIVFLIGRLFALSWLDTLRAENPFAICLFSQLLIMLFYFPANNQVAQSGESLVAFWGILFCWLFTRRKYVLKQR